MNGPIRPYMSLSLDGCIAGPDARAWQELGRNGGRLFDRHEDRGFTHLRHRARRTDERTT